MKLETVFSQGFGNFVFWSLMPTTMKPSFNTTAIVEVDACTHPNPGTATYAVVVFHQNQLTYCDKGLLPGTYTNNESEYIAFGKGLRFIADTYKRNDKITLRSDSKLVLNQVSGEWECNKPELLAYRDRCRVLIAQIEARGISLSIEWVASENNRADEYTRQSYKEATGKDAPVYKKTPKPKPKPEPAQEKRLLVYDIEIESAVPPKEGDRLPGIRYCKGWGDYSGMGIACLVAYELFEGQTRVLIYGREDVQEFQTALDRADEVVTFNGEAFDNKLLAAHDVFVDAQKSVDLQAILRAQTGHRYKLGDLSEANFNESKLEDGALAPVLWQQGKRMRVIRYCASDVALTVQLYQLVKAGVLVCPKSRQLISVSLTTNGKQEAFV